ncbi:hypothetical protein Gotur_004298 [Gossypium turneri]
MELAISNGAKEQRTSTSRRSMKQQRNKEATMREEMRAKNQFVCNRLKK